MRPGPRTVADGLRSQTDALTRAALVRMEEVLPWYRATPARDQQPNRAVCVSPPLKELVRHGPIPSRLTDGMKKRTIEPFQTVRCTTWKKYISSRSLFHSYTASMPPRYYAMATWHILFAGQWLDPATTYRR